MKIIRAKIIKKGTDFIIVANGSPLEKCSSLIGAFSIIADLGIKEILVEDYKGELNSFPVTVRKKDTKINKLSTGLDL